MDDFGDQVITEADGDAMYDEIVKAGAELKTLLFKRCSSSPICICPSMEWFVAGDDERAQKRRGVCICESHYHSLPLSSEIRGGK